MFCFHFFFPDSLFHDILLYRARLFCFHFFGPETLYLRYFCTVHAKALHSHFRENSKSTYSSSVCSLPVTIYTRDQLITLRYCCTLRGTYFRVRRYEPFFFFFFLRLAFYFPASGQAVDSGVVSFPFPPGTTYLQFSSRIGFSVPTAVRRFSSNVANSRSRAFRESICAQEKVPTNLYEYALGGTRTHAIDL